VQGAEQKPAKR